MMHPLPWIGRLGLRREGAPDHSRIEVCPILLELRKPSAADVVDLPPGLSRGRMISLVGIRVKGATIAWLWYPIAEWTEGAKIDESV
jgi:hypothetical protein